MPQTGKTAIQLYRSNTPAAAPTAGNMNAGELALNYEGFGRLYYENDDGTIQQIGQDPRSVAITGGSITGITDLAVADGGTGASNASGARTNLGLAIGTNVQAQNANLQSIADLASAADRLSYFTGSGTSALTVLTSFSRTLLDDTTAAAWRATLGVSTGTGDVIGPGASTSGNIVSWSGPSGINVADSGVAAASVVVGPASATDNAIVRFNGTTGKLVQDSTTAAIDDDGRLSGVRASPNVQSGSSYSVQASDTGGIVILTAAGAIAVTFPDTTPTQFYCTFLVTDATGVATFGTTGGGTIFNRQSQFDSAGQWAFVTAYVPENSGGSAAVIVIGGDTA